MPHDNLRGDPAAGPPKISPLDLFLAYLRISLSGFGGTLFWVHRVLVERKRWLSERQFAEYYAVSQLTTGANVFNMSIMVGHRFAGRAGAAAAAFGFAGAPVLVMVAMAVLYQHFGDLPITRRALTGMSAVAAGLVLANGVRMAAALPRQWRPWLFAFVAFVGVGLLRWPLLAVMGALAPLAIAASWREKR